MSSQDCIKHDVHKGGRAQAFGSKVKEYRRRNPVQSTNHKIIRTYFKSWQLEREQADGFAQVPHHIINEFEKFLSCGVLACGFARAYCGTCQQDFLIPYSCKGWSVCVTCNHRRMLETGIYLSEQIFPYPAVGFYP